VREESSSSRQSGLIAEGNGLGIPFLRPERIDAYSTAAGGTAMTLMTLKRPDKP